MPFSDSKNPKFFWGPVPDPAVVGRGTSSSHFTPPLLSQLQTA